MNSATEIWNKVLELLGKDLSDTAISTWFSDCRAVDITEDRFILYTTSDFKKGIIEGRFAEKIKVALYELLAADLKVTVLFGDELEQYNSSFEAKRSTRPDEDFTFDRFVVGNSNKFAHAAAMNVAYSESRAYNPLFIYGESGLGKTHLLHAIRNAVKERHPEFKIVFLKGDEFTTELIQAIQMGKNVEFREKYRGADLFLMDDIQFIAGKVSTQEEFFHTFNTLFESNRQIVFTSDRPPEEIARLENRLKTRFISGLIADIQPPDYETRMAIIRNKAVQLSMIISDEIANYIASNLTSNVRQLEGAVKKTVAYCELLQVDPLTLSVTEESKIIKDMFKKKSEYIPTPEDIIIETAKYYTITPEDIKGQRRTRNIAQARQVSMYLIRRLTNLSLSDIGDFYENRDHTTVRSSILKIENDQRTSEAMMNTIREISANINSKS